MQKHRQHPSRRRRRLAVALLPAAAGLAACTDEHGDADTTAVVETTAVATVAGNVVDPA